MNRHFAPMLVAFAALTTANGARGADEMLESKSSMKGRFGTLAVRNLDGEARFQLGGKPLPLSDYQGQVEKRWELGSNDVYLVSLASGGVACPSTYAFVTVSADKAVSTEPFGNCSDVPQVARVGDRVVVKFPRMSREAPATVIEYDKGDVYEGKKKVALAVTKR